MSGLCEMVIYVKPPRRTSIIPFYHNVMGLHIKDDESLIIGPTEYLKFTFGNALQSKHTGTSPLTSDGDQQWLMTSSITREGNEVVIHYPNVVICSLMKLYDVCELWLRLLQTQPSMSIIRELLDITDENEWNSFLYTYAGPINSITIYLDRILSRSIQIVRLPVDLLHYAKGAHKPVDGVESIPTITASLSIGSPVDITKLFNLVNSSDYGRVVVHSTNMNYDPFKQSRIQYLKTRNPANAYKGSEPNFNTCTIYGIWNVNKDISITRIEVTDYGDMRLVTHNISKALTYTQYADILLRWVSDNAWKLIDELNVYECVSCEYNNSITPSVSIASVTVETFINAPGVTAIDELSELIVMESFNLRFRTISSIEFNGVSTDWKAAVSRYMYHSAIHAVITPVIAAKNIAPSIHVGTSGDGVLINIKNAESYASAKANIHIVLGSISGAKPVSGELHGELSVKSILANAKQYGKNLLKLLEKLDPITFGPRSIAKNKKRSYSGLVQKQQQRPVPINEEEYNALVDVLPNSVINIRNQTYPSQRLYLLCPYDKFPIMNFHTFPGQSCIIRCTTRLSNTAQFNTCADAVNANVVGTSAPSYENQATVAYNPHISVGRTCKPPDELSGLLIEYVLLKLSVTSAITPFVIESYGHPPLIVKRNIERNAYEVITEVNKNADYVLIIQGEDADDYFVAINKEKSPYTVDANSPLLQMFAKSSLSSNFRTLYGFIELTFDIHVDNTNIIPYMNELEATHNITFVLDDGTLYGMIYNGCYYSLPKTVLNATKRTGIIGLKNTYKGIQNGSIKFPPITMFDTYTTAYRDFNSGLFTMISTRGVSMLIEPIDNVPANDVVIFDSDARLIGEFIKSGTSVDASLSAKNNASPQELVEQLIYDLYLMDIPVTHNTVYSTALRYGLIADKDDVVGLNNFVSKRRSRITKDTLNDVLSIINISDDEYVMNIVYDILCKNSEVSASRDEYVIPKALTI